MRTQTLFKGECRGGPANQEHWVKEARRWAVAMKLGDYVIEGHYEFCAFEKNGDVGYWLWTGPNPQKLGEINVI